MNSDLSADELYCNGVEFLSANQPSEAAEAFRAALRADPAYIDALHGLVRALREAGQFEASIASARALTVLAPTDPLAQTALSISLQHGNQIAEAEAARARARILEWKQQLAADSEAEPQAEERP